MAEATCEPDFASTIPTKSTTQTPVSILKDDTISNSSIEPTADIETGHSTITPPSAAASLTPEHRAYLLSRHGTVDLDPLPSSDPADPYNWPSWKKLTNLILVSFHAMMTTFIAAAIIPAYENIAEDLNTSITRASYLSSLQIAVLGYAPLFWKPVANRYGRRPVWLVSTMGSLLLNVGCALCGSYSSMAVCRAFVAFFICPAQAIGSAVVTETYFKRQRGQFMGLWTLLVTLGPPAGPFFMGFVAYQTGNYRWIYWVLAIVNGIQFIAYIFLGPETLYIQRGIENRGSAFKQEYLQFRRIDPRPLKLYDFIQPMSLFKDPTIVIPVVGYAIVFGFSSVLMTVEIPQLFIPKFGLNAQQIGLQFLGIIIGSVIGEQIGGRLSDFWMQRRAKSLNRAPEPEYRLWLSYFGFLLAIIGVIVFGVRYQQAAQGHWNVTPIIGVAITAVGNQIVTTVVVTYCIDSHVEQSASIGVFVGIIRQTWGFIGPFWYPDMLSSLGGSGSGGLMAGIIFVASWIPMMIAQWQGKKWRRAESPSVGLPQLEKPQAEQKESVKDEV